MVQLFFFTMKNLNDIMSTVEVQGEKKKNTYIFATHGFKHLLQLDSQLLNVVDQNARLHTEKEKHVFFISSKQGVAQAVSWMY